MEEYWNCTIGPIERSLLPMGSDGPMRSAVQKAFCQLTGDWAETIRSGWGVSEHDRALHSSLDHLLFLLRNCPKCEDTREYAARFMKTINGLIKSETEEPPEDTV